MQDGYLEVTSVILMRLLRWSSALVLKLFIENIHFVIQSEVWLMINTRCIDVIRCVCLLALYLQIFGIEIKRLLDPSPRWPLTSAGPP